MPLYEYQCRACGRRHEALQRVGDPDLETCPECGGALKKLLSAPAFQFKGSGWYVTDYARSGGGAGKGNSTESGGAIAEGSTAQEGKGKSAEAKGEGSKAVADKPATPSPSSSSAPSKD